MNAFANEILLNIFSRLPFDDRVECLLVCRVWYNILLGRILLHNIKFNKEHKFKEFADFIQRMPSRGAQVEILNLAFPPNDRYQNICDMFPNLRKIVFTNGSRWEREERFEGNSNDLPAFNSKLEEIEDLSTSELTCQLIMSNSCSRLTSLTLGLSSIDDPNNGIYIYLNNAPHLKTLDLYDGNIEIEDCEVIHRNLPILENFYLHDFILNYTRLPHNIKPATSVKRFTTHIRQRVDPTTYPNWYKYLAKKYTNLIEFECEDYEFSCMNQNTAMEIYRDGILPIYKNMGNRQQRIFKAINIPAGLNIAKELDESGCQIEYFHIEHCKNHPIFAQLAQSNLSTHVKHITLDATPISPVIAFQNFTSLRTVQILTRDEYWRNTNLTEYLNAFPPTLVAFKSVFGNVKISGLPTRSNGIAALELQCNMITPELCNVISNFFPKLVDLNLSGLVAENININLPNNHFHTIRIKADFVGGLPHGFSVTDAKSSQPQYFVGKKAKENDSYYRVVPATANDLQGRIKTNIKCGSVDKPFFNTSPFRLRLY